MSEQAEHKKRILSGKDSASLWRNINKLQGYSEPTHMAIYHLACKCQELEVLVRDLQLRLGLLESEQR